ncbi:DUF488 family protein [Nitrosomonas mobilis]|nr:DUF488 domain-containing protein [Nitrosomonas mobilis]
MMQEEQLHKNIWTIGHSIRSLEEFIEMLKSFQIGVVADVRSFPGSRRVPHFNKEVLEISLPQAGFRYIHIKNLGGRRKVRLDSKNTSWRHMAFRGYADYMETDTFRKGIDELKQIALTQPTAYMCSEAVWWRCHRSMISDFLKAEGWNVIHIMGAGKAEEHPYTQPARIVGGKLSYHPDGVNENT